MTSGSIGTVPVQLLIVPPDAAVVLALLGDHTFDWEGGFLNSNGGKGSRNECKFHTDGDGRVGALELWFL